MTVSEIVAFQLGYPRGDRRVAQRCHRRRHRRSGHPAKFATSYIEAELSTPRELAARRAEEQSRAEELIQRLGLKAD
jgi:hypothetical protein